MYFFLIQTTTIFLMRLCPYQIFTKRLGFQSEKRFELRSEKNKPWLVKIASIFSSRCCFLLHFWWSLPSYSLAKTPFLIEKKVARDVHWVVGANKELQPSDIEKRKKREKKCSNSTKLLRGKLSPVLHWSSTGIVKRKRIENVWTSRNQDWRRTYRFNHPIRAWISSKG